jgi:hypothetical protein
VTAILEAKARDLACVDFSKKLNVLDPRVFAGHWIDQLSLVCDQVAAVKLSGRKGEELLLVCTEIAALKTQVKAAQSQIENRPILSGLSGQLERQNSIREDVDQVKVNVKRIIELAIAMKIKDGLVLIAYPDPQDSGRAVSQYQKLCEILAHHSRVLFPIKSIDEDKDPIRSPVLLSQYPELHRQCGKLPRFIWKDPSEVIHRTKRVLYVEMKQYTGAWLFARILTLNREYLTDPKKTMHGLKVFIQRTDMIADYIAWTSWESADRRPEMVIQYPRFVVADFLPLFIQHSDLGLGNGCLCGPLDKLDAKLLFLRNRSEMKFT